jgi:hypothetical protein
MRALIAEARDNMHPDRHEIADAAEAELKKLERLRTELAGREAHLGLVLDQLAERDRADAELREACRNFGDPNLNVGRLLEALSRWEMKGGA